MASFIITSCLQSPGSDDVALTLAIERLTARSRECLPGTWIVAAECTAAELRDALRPCLGGADELLVAELSGELAWRTSRRDIAGGLREVLA